MKKKADTFKFTYTWLYHHYIELNLTPKQIGELVGYSSNQIGVLLRRFHIPAKRRSRNDPFPRDNKWCFDRYMIDKWTISRIADEVGWADSDVWEHLVSINIPLRSNKKIPGKDWLAEQYWDRNRNVTDIADEIGCNPNSVTKALIRHNIPIKSRLLCWRDKSKRQGDFTAGQRKAILARDGHKCQFLTCTQTEQLECHHILPTRYGGENLIANGITLCSTHHESIRYKELDWVNTFMEILRNQ